jgi:hypothetical protein
MRLTFLGKDTQGGGSPTLFATDRGTYVVQGWKVQGQRASVEIPKALLRHLDGRPRLDAALTDTGRDSYVLSGAVVADAEALSQMDIPGHETCIEVGKLREDGAGGAAAG